jgi:hypothetical protein
MGRVDASFHPGVDILAAADLPFVDVRGVAEFRQLGGKPKRPVAIALRIADEDIAHRWMIAGGEGEFKPRVDLALFAGREDARTASRPAFASARTCDLAFHAEEMLVSAFLSRWKLAIFEPNWSVAARNGSSARWA